MHFGHGLGLGAGGTPRSGASDACTSTSFVFVGAIAPGDGGSGADTLGTRATQVQATLADGRLVAYPVACRGVALARRQGRTLK